MLSTAGLLATAGLLYMGAPAPRCLAPRAFVASPPERADEVVTVDVETPPPAGFVWAPPPPQAPGTSASSRSAATQSAAAVVVAAAATTTTTITTSSEPVEPVAAEPASADPSSASSSDRASGAIAPRASILEANALWSMLSGHCGHLPLQGALNVRRSLDVLLVKTQAAEGGTTSMLLILSAIKTGQELLKLGLDAPTVVASMLGLAVTARSPTWPSAVPDPFWAEVDGLLLEQRRLRSFRALVPDLDDENANYARAALLRSLSNPRSGTDPRALVVLLACELTSLRGSDALPAASQQSLALEAVQLYAPLSHAVGFGETFYELEALAYSKLFPESLAKLRSWYGEVWADAHEVLSLLIAQLEAQLEEAVSLSGLLKSMHVTGRVKAVTSTFRKLLRDNVDDIGRVRVRPHTPARAS